MAESIESAPMPLRRYTAPMVAGWSWFPDRKGFVSGCVLDMSGAGTSS